MDEEAKPASWWRGKYIRILVLLVTIGIMVTLILLGWAYRDKIDEIKEFESFGYSFVFLFVFLMGIAGSSAPVWPLTGSLSAFLWAGMTGFGWSIFLMALAAGTGEAIGELSGYMLGYGGQPALENWKRFQRLEGWMKRHGSAAIFIMSAVPIPFHIIKLINASAAALRFPLWKMFLLCWMGKIIKCVGFALAGAGLLSWLTDLV